MKFKPYFLVALPPLRGTLFERAVVYIFEHNEHGAAGVVINHPSALKIGNLLTQLQIGDFQQAYVKNLADCVLKGGPISSNKGIVIHSPKRGFMNSQYLNSELMVTTSNDIFLSLGTANQPEKMIFLMGCMTWEKGRLDRELLENIWLPLQGGAELIYEVPIKARWETAVANYGITTSQVVSSLGEA